jgi:hypothetical protein
MANVAKSIIDVEIKDEAFKEFAALFQKYQSQLGKMPGLWNKVGSATQQSSKGFGQTAKNLSDAAQAMSNIYRAQTKVAAEQSKVNKLAKDTQYTFDKINKSTISIGKNIAATTLSLLKWTGIGLAAGLLGGAGGIFGLTSFASNIGSLRKQSQGLGVSAGELRAARVSYGRYAEVNPLLGVLSESKADINKQWAFGANRLNPNESSANLLPQLLKRAGQVYKEGPEATAQQRLQAQGLDLLGITTETARRMASISKEEQKDADDLYQRNIRTLGVVDKTLAQWQKFNVKVDEAGEKIKTTFINGLVGLTGPLGNLADSFSTLLASFLNNPQLPHWIDVFGKKIEEFAQYLAGDRVKVDIDNFLDKMKAVGSALYDLAVFTGKFIPSAEATQKNREYYAPGGEADQKALASKKKSEQSGSWTDYFWNPSGNIDLSKTVAERNNNPLNLRFVGQQGAVKGDRGFAKFETEQQGFLAAANQLKMYNTGTSAAAGNKKLETLEQIIGQWAPASENDTQAYVNTVAQATGFKKDQKLDLVNDHEALAKLISAMSSVESGKKTYSPQDVDNFLNSGAKQVSSNTPNWNPTPIALSVNMVKPVGMDVNVNMLQAGGYYSALSGTA